MQVIRKNNKALSPVIGSIILIGVSVAVSVVVAAWMGGISIGLMGNAEQATITNVVFLTSPVNSVNVTILNNGARSVTLQSATIDGNSANLTTTGPTNSLTIAKGSSTSVLVTNSGSFISGAQYTIRITTSKGNTLLFTTEAKLGSANPTPSPTPTPTVSPSHTPSPTPTATPTPTPSPTPTPTTLLSDGFEASGGAWDNNWDGHGTTAWDQSNSQVHSGSYSARSSNHNEGDFTTDSLNTNGASSVTVSFWLYHTSISGGNLRLYFRSTSYGGSYVSIANLGNQGSDNTWTFYTVTSTDSHYLQNDFSVRLTTNLGNGEYVYIDDVTVTTIT